AGQYSVQLRYSAGNGASSNTGLFVNGVQTATLSCPATASWDAWSTVTNTVTLNAGSNTIAYRAVTSANACINLDNITIPSIGGITPQTIDIIVNCPTTGVAPMPLAAKHPVSLSPSAWYARVIGNRIVLPAATPLPAAITLYNLAGTQIYRGVVTGRRVKISGERKLPEGIYIVKVGR
ncbi:MAG: carbohydrate-binding protein, partial [Chitinispirillaceae bacterium]|nr:carbohydrate-binding protein [Chitinispirillaceae bacterium]